jgi:hypothetical protein
MEEVDVNAYDCTAYAPGQISLATTDYYTTYYTGTCTSGNGLSDAYVYNGSAWTLIGQAWLPGCATSHVKALTEFGVFGSTSSCTAPTLTQYEHFGNNTKTLYQSSNGTTWTKWTTSTSTGPTAPLSITPTPPTSTAKFKTWS